MCQNVFFGLKSIVMFKKFSAAPGFFGNVPSPRHTRVQGTLGVAWRRNIRFFGTLLCLGHRGGGVHGGALKRSNGNTLISVGALDAGIARIFFLDIWVRRGNDPRCSAHHWRGSAFTSICVSFENALNSFPNFTLLLSFTGGGCVFPCVLSLIDFCDMYAKKRVL